MADEHKAEAARLLEEAHRRTRPDWRGAYLQEAQVHATLHLAEMVERAAVVLDYIDAKLERR